MADTPEEKAKQEREDYRLQARALFDLNIERVKFTGQVQSEYGKWLLVTITSTHLAALYLVSRPEVPDAIRQEAWSYWPFVAGICLILLSALSTWANWTLAYQHFEDWVDVRSLVDKQFWPKDAPKWRAKWIKRTFYLPFIFGIPSALCILWGAYEILPHIHIKPPAAVQKASVTAPSLVVTPYKQEKAPLKQGQ